MIKVELNISQILTIIRDTIYEFFRQLDRFIKVPKFSPTILLTNLPSNNTAVNSKKDQFSELQLK